MVTAKRVKGMAAAHPFIIRPLIASTMAMLRLQGITCAWLMVQLQRRYGLGRPDTGALKQLVKLFAPTGGVGMTAMDLSCTAPEA